MKNLIQLFVFTILFSISAIAQNNEKQQETNSKYFDVFTPNEGDRPNQFLTTYLRTHKRFNLSRDIKRILTNSNTTAVLLRPNMGKGYGTSSLTQIYLDNVQIFGEGINRLYVIENTRTNDIKKITRSQMGYDNIIKIYSTNFKG